MKATRSQDHPSTVQTQLRRHGLHVRTCVCQGSSPWELTSCVSGLGRQGGGWALGACERVGSPHANAHGTLGCQDHTLDYGVQWGG